MFTTMGQIGGMTVGSLGGIGAGKSNIRLRLADVELVEEIL